MAETTLIGQRAAENAFLKWAFPAVCAALMGLAGIVGMQVLEGQKQNNEALASIKVDVAVMKTDIGYLKEKVKP